MTRRLSRRRRPPVAAVLALALVVSACGEDVEVSRNQAIEVLVLDGVQRERAECIVAGADGVLSFAKLTGIDVDITEDELTELARISASCVVAEDNAVAIVGGDTTNLEEAERAGAGFDRDAEVERLITAGVAPAVAACVGVALSTAADPAESAASEQFITEAIRVCDGGSP